MCDHSNLDVARHTMAHVLAAAVKKMFPEAVFGVGPVIENGCYYDFVLPRNLIPEDLQIIQKEVQKILNRNLAIKYEKVDLGDAFVEFESLRQPLKIELLNDLKTRGTTEINKEVELFDGTPDISIYRLVDENTGEVLFTDLCRGPHVENAKVLKNLGFKVDKFSGAYWRGDQKRDIQMQRLYMLVFENKGELNNFVLAREEAKKRDHRVLNEQLKFFTISERVGSGLPLLQPKGAMLKKILEDWLWQMHKPLGYQRVWTPHITKPDLYETSGHAAKFGDELFVVHGKEDKFFMKPMNCPHHMQIFADNQWSYKDLPVRYFEPGTVYRDEKSGQLSGLTRVRSLTQDDGHLFCRLDQMQSEVGVMVKIIKQFYTELGMIDDYWVSLSVRDLNDKKMYLGEDKNWEMAEKALEEAAIFHGLNYKKVEGEAAFYGPKLDFMFKDSLGREWQLATIQCDFNLPERFDLYYIDENGEKARPVVFHRAISGSLERFMGVFIEHTAGKLPFWLSPEQIRILTVNNEKTTLDYVEKVKNILNPIYLMKPLKYNELRFSVDDRNESLGKKIREATVQKIPMQMIIGPKDVENEVVSIRFLGEEKTVSLTDLPQFFQDL